MIWGHMIQYYNYIALDPENSILPPRRLRAGKNCWRHFTSRSSRTAPRQHTFERDRTTSHSPASATVPQWDLFDPAYSPAPAPRTPPVARGFPPPRPATHHLPAPANGQNGVSCAGDTHYPSANTAVGETSLLSSRDSRRIALGAPLAMRATHPPVHPRLPVRGACRPQRESEHMRPQFLTSCLTHHPLPATTRPPMPTPARDSPKATNCSAPHDSTRSARVLSTSASENESLLRRPVRAATAPGRGPSLSRCEGPSRGWRRGGESGEAVAGCWVLGNGYRVTEHEGFLLSAGEGKEESEPGSHARNIGLRSAT